MAPRIVLRIQEAFNALEPIDREILTLRHFEHLSRTEAARVLKIEEVAAATQYIPAPKLKGRAGRDRRRKGAAA